MGKKQLLKLKAFSLLPPQRVFELLYTEKPLTDRDPMRLLTFHVTAHN